MFKLEIFIPTTHLEAMREALKLAGAGAHGCYDSALSYSLVRGCWRPLPGANPYHGEIGVLQEADEYKVEVGVSASLLNKTLEAVKAVHPYEVPVINVIRLYSDYQPDSQ